MTIALGAAGVTVAVVLAIIGIPVVNACAADSRGLVACMRDMVDRRFDLPGQVSTEAMSTPSAVTEPVREIEAELPAREPTLFADAEPQLADAPMGQGGPLLPEQPAPDDTPPQPERVADLGPMPVSDLPAPRLPRARPPEAGPSDHAEVEKPAVPATTMADPAPSDAPEQPRDLADKATPPAIDVPSEPPRALALAPDASLLPQSESAPTSPAAATAEDAAPPRQPAAEPAPTAAPLEPQPPTEALTPPPFANQPPREQIEPPPPELVETPPPAPPPAVAQPSAPAVTPSVPEEMVVAAGPEPEIPQSTPAAAAPVALAPTIDAIELDGARSFVSGSGPAGAMMRLSADDEIVGESPVEDGRWLVETGPLLTSPRQELKIEAFDPDTGRSLGEAAITVEVELPSDAPPLEQQQAPAPSADDEPSPTPPEQRAPPPLRESPPAPEPEASTAPAEPPVVAEHPIVPTGNPPEIDAAPRLADTPADAPLPGLLPVTPRRETNSVTILGSPDASPSTATLEAREPAIRAALVSPQPTGEPVNVLRLYPLGDPVYGRFSGGQAIIRRGDTLWTLARRYYGAGIHYRTIFDANRTQIRRPSRIFPGQVFDLPLVTRD